jgi:hypothetical protein
MPALNMKQTLQRCDSKVDHSRKSWRKAAHHDLKAENGANFARN